MSSDIESRIAVVVNDAVRRTTRQPTILYLGGEDYLALCLHAPKYALRVGFADGRVEYRGLPIYQVNAAHHIGVGA